MTLSNEKADTRNDDPPGATSRYRSDRLQQDGKKWFFSTREGTLEGPFDDRFQAINALEQYLTIMQLDLLGADSTLSLADKP